MKKIIYNKEYFIYNSNYNENYFSSYKDESRLAVNNFFIGKINNFRKLSSRILDIGFGNGSFFYSLLKGGYPLNNLYGIDVHQFMIRHTSEELGIRRENLNVVDIQENISCFDNNFFDVITSFDVIEHLSRERAFFEEVHRLIKDDGRIIFETPTKNSLFWRIVKDKDKTHINLKTKKEWINTFIKYGFEIIEDNNILFYNYIPFFDKIIKFKTARPLFTPSLISQEMYFVLKKV